MICSLRLRSQPPSRGLAIQSRSLPSAAGCRKSHIVCESRSKDMLFFDLEPLINEKMICIVSRPELDERCLTVHSDSEFRARLLSDAADEVISCTTGNKRGSLLARRRCPAVGCTANCPATTSRSVLVFEIVNHIIISSFS